MGIKKQKNSTYPDAGYPDRLGPSGKHFLTVIGLYLLCLQFLPQVSNTYEELYINGLIVRK